jgi:eukaryotic-like serine/threonine-protein kinase
VCPKTGKALERRRITRPVPPRNSAPPSRPPPGIAAEANLPKLPSPPSSTGGGSDRPRTTTGPMRAIAPIGRGHILERRYEVLRTIGAGAMGTVYECQHLLLKRKVAVKVLHASTAASPVSVRRFRHEARIAGALGHPNVCTLIDLGETEDGLPFLVMELLEGETLAERLVREGVLPLPDVVEIGAQILAGLAAAHASGVVHRDIKPANVFLQQRVGVPPTAKLIDFGISKMISADDLTQLTRVGKVVGTPAYMAPEQTRGDPADLRVDIYSTGVLLFEVITGRRPFEGRDIETLVGNIQGSPAPAMRIFRPEVPEIFEIFVAKAMHRDRNKRYPSALEMQRDLLAIGAHLLHGVRPPKITRADTSQRFKVALSDDEPAPRSVAVVLDENALQDDTGEDDDKTEVRPPKTFE